MGSKGEREKKNKKTREKKKTRWIKQRTEIMRDTKKGNWGGNCCRQKKNYEVRDKWAKEGEETGLAQSDVTW